MIFELPIFAYAPCPHPVLMSLADSGSLPAIGQASSLLRRFGTTKLILLAQLAWVLDLRFHFRGWTASLIASLIALS